MTKAKKPARKGGAKKCAPKKAPARKKPIPQQVVERTVSARMREIQENTARMVEAEQRLALEPKPMPPPAPRYPAPPPQSKRSKYWRQYKDTVTGFFIPWIEAAKRTTAGVTSRLRLRKPVDPQK